MYGRASSKSLKGEFFAAQLQAKDPTLLGLIDCLKSDKEILVLHSIYVDGLSVDEIASLTNMYDHDVVYNKNRGLKHLYQLYRDYRSKVDGANSIDRLVVESNVKNILQDCGIWTITSLERIAQAGTLTNIYGIGNKKVEGIKRAYFNLTGKKLVFGGNMTGYNENVAMNMQLLDLYMKRYGLSKDDATKLISIVDDVVFTRLKARRK